jgi:hypothetical protein
MISARQFLHAGCLHLKIDLPAIIGNAVHIETFLLVACNL